MSTNKPAPKKQLELIILNSRGQSEILSTSTRESDKQLAPVQF